MIFHQSPYGQVIKFSTNLYYSLSDEKLAEIEQNCANIDREVITISNSLTIETVITDLDIDLNVDLDKDIE